MRYLQPFFLLMTRASVFWISAVVFLSLSFVLVALGQPNQRTTPYVDAAFLATFAFPAAAGWLGGAVIQEFLHCSFAWPLPAVLKRIAAGFAAAGLVLSLVVAALASLSPKNAHGFLTLLAVGLAGYILSGDLFAPLHRWTRWINTVVIAFLVVRSRSISEWVAAHPLPTIVICLGMALFGILRLFSRTGFRRRAFRLAAPFPGSYSLERSIGYERQKLAEDGPRSLTWTPGYLGTDTWNWVRATIRTHGPWGWATVGRVLSRLWVLGLLLVIYAWSDKGDLGFGEALGKTIHGALFSSPYVPVFGQQSDRHPIVILVIAATGAVLALWSPVDLKTSLSYPLSRQRLATVTHRVGLLGTGAFFAGVFGLLSIAGFLAGWFVGYPLRFDFMPFFLQPLLATVILMPLAYWGRLHLQRATQRRTENTLVAFIFGIIGFVATVWIWSAALSVIPAPMMQIAVSILLFCVSQILYGRKLKSFFSTADLS